MSSDVLFGLQWGDEGKGKLVDLISSEYDAVVRYQGGDNAGHTVVKDGKTLKFHHIPSGIATAGMIAVMGHGMVINLVSLSKELEMLRATGLSAEGLRISDRSFVILPSHKRDDARRESSDAPIGTTGRGIGPAYMDKYGRSGIRIGDFLSHDILERLRKKGLSADEAMEQRALFERIRAHVCDTALLLDRMEKDGAHILLEGAQGIMLDIDYGTYPYVTSSSPNPAGAVAGSGVKLRSVKRIIGVMKAYTTRVGLGPFPTELENEIGERIRKNGNEYGTTTGRPRRCGWLDLAQLRYAVRVCDCSELAVMKLDVLSGFDELKYGSAYETRNGSAGAYPSRIEELSEAKVRFASCPGWKEDIAGCRDWAKLPAAARNYLDLVEREIGVPIKYVSTSPDQKDTIIK